MAALHIQLRHHGLVEREEETFSLGTLEERKEVYRTLHSSKWKEVIDGCFHHLGKLVFDEGLHGYQIEPGYLSSIENAMRYIEHTLGDPVTPHFYLRLHSVACAHFRGEATSTLMGQEAIGVFRGEEDHIYWDMHRDPYDITPEAELAFRDLNLGGITTVSPTCRRMSYRVMYSTEVEALFRELVADLERDLQQVQELLPLSSLETLEQYKDGVLFAISRFTQKHDWLHPVKDGTGRLEMLLTGKLLAENGLHPAIVQYPYMSACKNTAEWKEILKEGLNAWEGEAQMVHLQRENQELNHSDNLSIPNPENTTP